MESEVHVPAPAAIFCFFVFSFIGVSILWRSKTRNSDSKMPPGPPKVPILGNMHQMGNMPHQTLAKWAKQYGPLMHVKLGGLSSIVVSSPEMAKEVMKTHDIIFANRPYLLAADVITYGSKSMSFSPYGSYWRQMRKISTLELLTPKRVESFRPIREEEISNLVKEIALSEGSLFNLSEKISSMVCGLTSRIAFGGKSTDREAFVVLMKEVAKLLGGFFLADLYPYIGVLHVLTGLRSKAEKVHQEIDRILRNIVRDHEDRVTQTEAIYEKAEDIVDVLLKFQKQNNLEYPLSDEIIKATLLVRILLLWISIHILIMSYAMSLLVSILLSLFSNTVIDNFVLCLKSVKCSQREGGT